MWQGAGQAIRRNRRASRRTRAELAAAAQTEESLIEALELGRGERDLPLSQFFRICAATGYERCLLFSHPRIHIPEPDDDSFWGPIKRLGE
jgi:transcriptional regulator with XRE-family HTH domain